MFKIQGVRREDVHMAGEKMAIWLEKRVSKSEIRVRLRAKKGQIIESYVGG